MQTKFYLIRHGQSIGNAWRRYLGHTDLGLTDLGRIQAEETANALSGVKIDAIYSSDLKRAHETALPHAKLRGLNIYDSENLREIFIGDWEGAAVDDLKTLHYREFVVEWLGKFGTFAFPGGESVAHAMDRFYNEVKRIADKHPGETVLITSHAAIIRAFWCKISGIELEKMGEESVFPSNASYSTVIYDGKSFIPERFSVDEHIKSKSGL